MPRENRKISSESDVSQNGALMDKLHYFTDVINTTVIYSSKYKLLDVMSSSDLDLVMSKMTSIAANIKHAKSILTDVSGTTDCAIADMQTITDELSIIFKNYGTGNFDDIITICFGTDFLRNFVTQVDHSKVDIIRKYFHPTGYKLMTRNSKNVTIKTKNNRVMEDFQIVDSCKQLDCIDMCRASTKFQVRVYGMKVCIIDETGNKTMIIRGIMDDVYIPCLDSPFLTDRLSELRAIEDDLGFQKFVDCITIKEILCGSSLELHQKYIGYKSQVTMFNQKDIQQVINDFLTTELYIQRQTLIQMLLSNRCDSKYISYLLYDLLSSDSNSSVDTHEQTLLYDSLPFIIRKSFKDAMKDTIKYTTDLANFSSSKIPLEQQICLIKASDSVKEKAMIKLKEVKSKSDDTGSKARQYLEGLLKIPFGIILEEKMLTVSKNLRRSVKDYIVNCRKLYNISIPDIENICLYELIQLMGDIRKDYMDILSTDELNQMTVYVRKSKKRELVQLVQRINSMFRNASNIDERISYAHKKNKQIQDEIIGIITNTDYNSMIKEYYYFINYDNIKMEIYKIVKEDLKLIDKSREDVKNYMSHVRTELESSVHGHSKAKRQIERIIGQWMNGDNDGYAFGFEGPPGVGKTSLAKKGIATCLKDNNGENRPFALIAVGGASNGSVFEGHNYTYVGSTWGKICDILMETKCMNPIIFIDELDKISRTEHGKEIVGILTHLIDGTQNDKFQDKYFSGVELDLSKVLFVFSYNDVELVDRILLDRIHRVKFKSLTLEDKLIISRDFIIPEILGKMGMKNSLSFSDETITLLIDTYTNEAGVRKLKELLFEIISEINLLLLDGSTTIRVPTEVSFEDIKTIYLKEHHMRIKYTIHLNPSIGLINGLWANAVGDGGVLAIEAKWFPTTTFLDLKLTGMQGDVMKESMNVAKTLAWDLSNATSTTTWLKSFKKTNKQGIHIHCPDGATPKDGPSAGTAITVAIYSLFNNRPIRNDIAITGEITLHGNITAIGGLDNKLYGGLAAGVKEYIFPSENKKDFQEFIERMEGTDKLDGIQFHEVSTIQEVFSLVFT